MRRPERETTALTAVLVAVAGLLALYYTPAPLLPSLITATVAAVVTTAVAARAARASIPGMAIEVALLYTTVIATVLHVTLAALAHLLGAAQGWLEQARTTTNVTYIHAA